MAESCDFSGMMRDEVRESGGTGRGGSAVSAHITLLAVGINLEQEIIHDDDTSIHSPKAENEEPQTGNESSDNNDKPLSEHQEALSRRGSSDSVGTVEHGEVIVHHPKESGECFHEPVKARVGSH
jgi:hypothetical protein